MAINRFGKYGLRSVVLDTEKSQTLGGLQQFCKDNSDVCFLFVVQSLIVTGTDWWRDECRVKESGVALHLDNIQLLLKPRHKNTFVLQRSVIRLITLAAFPVFKRGLSKSACTCAAVATLAGMTGAGGLGTVPPKVMKSIASLKVKAVVGGIKGIRQYTVTAVEEEIT